MLSHRMWVTRAGGYRRCRQAARLAGRLALSGLLVGAVLAAAGPAVGQVPGWSVVPSPNEGTSGSRLNAVSCVLASGCTAVGFHLVNVFKTLIESSNSAGLRGGRRWPRIAA
jgi:hypothetical protein